MNVISCGVSGSTDKTKKSALLAPCSLVIVQPTRFWFVRLLNVRHFSYDQRVPSTIQLTKILP